VTTLTSYSLVFRILQAGCLSLEKEVIDTTTEEGKRHLRDIEAVMVDAEATEFEKMAQTKSAYDFE